VGEVAKIMADSGVIVLTAFISPYVADRAIVRAMMAADEFIEVYVNAPVEVCEARDPKGLYAKARSGQITDFTGVSAPYEPPAHPELELRTDRYDVEQCAAQVMEFLDRRIRKQQVGPGADDVSTAVDAGGRHA
jgi:adenylyl-sulfate kinase